MKNAIIYPVITLLAWALSAPIVAQGHRNTPNRKRFQYVLVGLLVSLIFGSICALVGLLITGDGISINAYTIIVGISTFPLGTGLYYLCGLGMGNRMEVAAQFSQVHPLITILFAIVFFHEILRPSSVVAIALTTLGLGLLLWSAYSHVSTFKPIVWGVGTGICWSIGELLAKLSMTAESSYQMTASALLIGTLVALAVLAPFLVRT